MTFIQHLWLVSNYPNLGQISGAVVNVILRRSRRIPQKRQFKAKGLASSTNSKSQATVYQPNFQIHHRFRDSTILRIVRSVPPLLRNCHYVMPEWCCRASTDRGQRTADSRQKQTLFGNVMASCKQNKKLGQKEKYGKISINLRERGVDDAPPPKNLGYTGRNETNSDQKLTTGKRLPIITRQDRCDLSG